MRCRFLPTHARAQFHAATSYSPLQEHFYRILFPYGAVFFAVANLDRSRVCMQDERKQMAGSNALERCRAAGILKRSRQGRAYGTISRTLNHLYLAFAPLINPVLRTKTDVAGSRNT